MQESENGFIKSTFDLAQLKGLNSELRPHSYLVRPQLWLTTRPIRMKLHPPEKHPNEL